MDSRFSFHQSKSEFAYRSSPNWGILFLILFLFGLSLSGIKLSHVISTRLWKSDGQAAAQAWMESILRFPDGIWSLLDGKVPSESTGRLLADASQLGDVYRYRVWDRSGKPIYFSERTGSIDPPDQRHVLNVIRSRKADIELKSGVSPQDPKYFLISYFPLNRGEEVIGVLEIYLNQTPYYHEYSRYAIFRQTVIIVAVIFAGGLPAFMFYRKLLDLRQARSQAQYLTKYDGLTGLPNRQWLEFTARGRLKWTETGNTHAAALLVNVNRFKDVNDSFGHDVGDALLRVFAERIQSLVRVEDVVARVGADEFIVLQVGTAKPDASAILARQLIEILGSPYQVEDLQIICGSNIGVAIFPSDAREWHDLLTCADIALGKAKEQGRNTICFFEAGMDVGGRERRILEAQLHQAIEDRLIQIAYQPIVDLRDGRLVGFESLLRWPEDWDPKSPATFIPIAEESGLIVPMGIWALETACRTAASWDRALKVAVNLSPVQFRDGDLVSGVEQALKLSGLDPGRLELEVTESLLLQNIAVVSEQLEQLRSLGVSIALDDFGTGYSSLAYLSRLPFHKVKIDRSFVSEMKHNSRAEAIVNTIIAMGKTLSLVVLAEGIESIDQAQTLSRYGCDQGQGFLFGQPLSEASVSELASVETIFSLMPMAKTD